MRGVYPSDLNEGVAYRLAGVFVRQYPDAQKIVLARDPRLSSPRLAKAIIKGLVEQGREVIDIGIAPDPLFYFAIFHYQLDGGIMVSGSHNTKEYNGLMLHIRKAPQKQSEDIIGRDLEQIKKMVLKGGEDRKKPQKEGRVRKLDLSLDYINYVSRKIKLKRALKIVIDSGNGACGFLPEKVFKKLGCQVKTIYGDFDGSFPHHLPDPYEEETLKDLKKEVLEEKADLGFAFDADGDRVGPVDNQGRLISGDACLLMLVRQVLKKKKGPLVHCLRISKAFLDEMAREKVKTYFSVSHHSALIRKIIETGAVFGGEITYHFLFPLDYYLCDEAIFSALKLAEIASRVDDLAKYVDGLPHYFASPEVFIETADEKKFQIIESLQEYLKKEGYDFIDIDGARINFENGWALARASNTGPYIKCRFEGETKKDLLQIEKKSLAIFKEVGIPVTPKTYRELTASRLP